MLWLSWSQPSHASSSAIRIGVDLSPADFHINDQGALTGLQYDLCTYLFADTLVEWLPFTKHEIALEALKRGEIDLYATSFPYNSEEVPTYALATLPMYVSGFALVYRSDSFENEEWPSAWHLLPHVPVHIPAGADNIRMVLEHLRDFSFPSIVIVEEEGVTPEQLCLKIQQHQIDYAVIDRNVAHAIGQRVDSLKIVANVSLDKHQVWLLNKSQDTLLMRINSILDTVRTQRSWQQILKKYNVSQ